MMTAIAVRRIALLPFVCVLAILAACGGSRRADNMLRRADAVMQEHPDTALAIISRLDASKLGSAELRARHALLHARALDKTMNDEPADSLADIALDFYRYRADYPRERMMAFYYKANARYNAADYAQAIFYLHIADTLAIDVDPSFRILTCGLLAHAYFGLPDISHELEYSLKVLDICRETADTIYLGDAMLGAAACYMQFDKYDEAYALLSDPRCSEDYYSLAKYYAGKKMYAEFDSMMACHPKLLMSPRFLSLYARKLIEDDRLDQAQQVLESIKSYRKDYPDSLQWETTRRNLLLKKRKYKEAYESLQLKMARSYMRYNELLAKYQHSSKLKANEYMATIKLNEERLRSERNSKALIVAFAAIALLLLVALIAKTVYDKRLRRAEDANKRLEVEAKKQARVADSRQRESELWKRRAAELTHELTSPIPSGLTDEEFFDRAVARLAEIEDLDRHTPSSSRARRAAIETQIKQVYTPELVKRFDKIINLRFDNLMVKAAALGLSSNELTLLRCIAMRMSRRHIELILGVNTNALGARKSRLKAKIAAAGLDAYAGVF